MIQLAESNSKKLKRFKQTSHEISLRIIELYFQNERPWGEGGQRGALSNQIMKLGLKKQMYERKIKALEEAIYETR